MTYGKTTKAPSTSESAARMILVAYLLVCYVPATNPRSALHGRCYDSRQEGTGSGKSHSGFSALDWARRARAPQGDAALTEGHWLLGTKSQP